MIFLQLTSIYGWVLVIWNLICMISWAFLNMLSFKINYYIIHKSNLNPYQKMFMVRPKIALFSPNRSVFNTRCQLVTPLIFQYLANTNSNLRSPPWQTQIRSVFYVEEGKVTLRAKVVLKLEYPCQINNHYIDNKDLILANHVEIGL